jgi:hypothetical protein
MSIRPVSAGFTAADPEGGVEAGVVEAGVVDAGAVEVTADDDGPADGRDVVVPLQAEISTAEATAASSPVAVRRERLMAPSSSHLITKA